MADAHPQLELSEADRDELNLAWHRMGVWDDVPDALRKLREHYIVSILTVLSLAAGYRMRWVARLPDERS